jgi:hypothetical protein
MNFGAHARQAWRYMRDSRSPNGELKPAQEQVHLNDDENGIEITHLGTLPDSTHLSSM